MSTPSNVDLNLVQDEIERYMQASTIVTRLRPVANRSEWFVAFHLENMHFENVWSNIMVRWNGASWTVDAIWAQDSIDEGNDSEIAALSGILSDTVEAMKTVRFFFRRR